MKLIVRYIKARGQSREAHNVPFTGDKATIGRGTNQSIQLLDRRVPLAHSTITAGKNGLEMKAAGGFSFTVNDQVQRRAELVMGDVISILGHEIKVLSGEDDADYVLEVTVNTETIDSLRDRYKTRIWELNFPQRRISWILFLFVLLITIGIPSVGFLTGMEFMRSSPMPDDGIWKTGELHDTHAFLGDKCENCHALPFVPARDEECLNCHLSVKHHFDKKKLQATYRIGDDCQDCHREHGGSDSIIRTDQAVCTVCHADLAALGFETDRLRNATDFLDDHPSFMVTMLEQDEQKQWSLTRKEIWDDTAIENSNLKFSHELHMNSEGINGLDGVEIMECGDCHTIQKGGLRMNTVTMEQHCADCHQLTFDPATPDRVVPHGQPEELMWQLRGYYADQFLRANDTKTVQPPTTTLREARRPGRRGDRRLITEFLSGEDSSKIAKQVTAEASAYVDAHVAEAAANLFERQTCVVCHEVSIQDGDVPFKVEPVRLTPDWFPMSEFSHDRHKNMACGGCHEAEYSDSAADVLMPDIASCRNCHGGEHARGRVQSTCIACHKFHLDSQGPMGMLLYINEQGDLVDSEGHFVDEAGNLIDVNGNLVDREGNFVDEDGNIIDVSLDSQGADDQDDADQEDTDQEDADQPGDIQPSDAQSSDTGLTE